MALIHKRIRGIGLPLFWHRKICSRYYLTEYDEWQNQQTFEEGKIKEFFYTVHKWKWPPHPQFHQLSPGGIEGTRGRTRRNSNNPAHRSKEATTAAPRTTTTTPWQIWVEIRRLRYPDHIIDKYHISHMLLYSAYRIVWLHMDKVKWYVIIFVSLSIRQSLQSTYLSYHTY